MLQLERNSLVWPTPEGWATLHAQALPDPAALVVVQHWQAQRLPLVVGRQTPMLVEGLITLGLPAPAQWGRRRLSFTVPLAQLAYSGPFPSLSDATQRQRWRRQAQALEQALAECLGRGAAAVQVYGSYGWQCLTGLRYLHDDSDIDLRLAVPDLAAARSAIAVLEAQPLPCRIDGELVFRSGHAVAWRELAQLLQGQVPQVIAKRLEGVALLTLAELLPLDEAQLA